LFIMVGSLVKTGVIADLGAVPPATGDRAEIPLVGDDC